MANEVLGKWFKHSDEQFEIDVAKAKRGICPECDADLTIHDPEAHAEYHWDTRTLQETLVSDAHRRKALVLAYAKLHPRATTPTHNDVMTLIEQQVSQAMVPKES
jgi:hypothetical protein